MFHYLPKTNVAKFLTAPIPPNGQHWRVSKEIGIWRMRLVTK